MNSALLALIVGELAVVVVAGLWFVIAYGFGRGPAGRHLTAVAAVMSVEALGLLLVVFRVPVPLWVFAVVYGAADIVVVQRLVLLYRARRAADDSPEGGPE